jgi:hypothetical protein
MQNNFTLLARGLATEHLKHKGTFMLWFVFIVPIVVTSIVLLTLAADDNFRPTDPWRSFIAFNYRPYFHITILLQILFIANLNHIEHRNNTWKVLRVLPVPFHILFIAKVVFGWLVMALYTILFYTLVMLSGTLLSILRPEIGFQHNTYFLEAFIPATKFFLASSAVTTIMYWISDRFRSLLVSVIAGLIGYASAFALFLINNRPGYNGFPYARFHPFNFSGYAFDSFGTGNHSLNVEYVYYGVAAGLLILTSHYLFSRHKNVV